jgi:hypothetical protein
LDRRLGGALGSLNVTEERKIPCFCRESRRKLENGFRIIKELWQQIVTNEQITDSVIKPGK